jgi:hypothetical protein
LCLPGETRHGEVIGVTAAGSGVPAAPSGGS